MTLAFNHDEIENLINNIQKRKQDNNTNIKYITPKQYKLVMEFWLFYL